MRDLADAPLARAFAVQLVHRLHGQDPWTMPVVAWLETRLGEQGTSADQVVAQEHHAQAAASVTVRNIITSMRWMSSVDWFEFFESVSLVDEVLRAVPGFTDMDFATRDTYRAQVEQLARGSGRSEIEVAREAASRALRAGREDEPAGTSLRGLPRQAEQDTGYYLLAGGREALERSLAYRVPLRARLLHALRAHALSTYLGAIATLTAALLAVLLFVSRSEATPAWNLALMGLLGLVPRLEHRDCARPPPRLVSRPLLAAPQAGARSGGSRQSFERSSSCRPSCRGRAISRGRSRRSRCTTSPIRMDMCTSPSSRTWRTPPQERMAGGR